MKKFTFKIFALLVFSIIFLISSSLSLYAKVELKEEKEIFYKKEDLLLTTTSQDANSQTTMLELSGLSESNEIKTFEEKKVFIGVAESGAEIVVTSYALVEATSDNWKEIKTYKTTVGASGIFNLTIDFSLGESIIIFKATKGKVFSQQSLIVHRKKQEIREQIKEQSPLVTTKFR